MIHKTTTNPIDGVRLSGLFYVAVFPALFCLLLLGSQSFGRSAGAPPVDHLATWMPTDTGGDIPKVHTAHNRVRMLKPSHKMLKPLAPIASAAKTRRDTTGASGVLQRKTVRKANPVKKPVKKKLKAENAFNSIIRDVADRHQVDPAIVKAIIMAESGYNPRAVSKRGAKGLMQLMPTTAKSLGVRDSFNPEQNIKAGVRYFKHLLKRFNHDTTLALAAYNAGSRHVRNYNGVPPFNSTKRYIEKVYRYHKIYQAKSDG